MSERPVQCAIVGVGDIATKAYLPNLKAMHAAGEPVEVVAIADADADRAESVGELFNVARVGAVDAVLADPAVELVVNLTVPAAHAGVSMRAIELGKHVYVEKPLAATFAEAQRVLEAAEAKGVRVAGAPDTVLGPAFERCRALVASGAIGRPVAATGFMLCPGHESWHRNPGFFYEPGGGPMFDMGPYYLTAMVELLGPIRSVSGGAGIQVPTRTIGSVPRRGETIEVRTPDHVAATVEFHGGAIGTLVMSFATHFGEHLTGQGGDAAPITVFGTGGTLRVPDPNGFEGVVRVRGVGDKAWRDETLAAAEGAVVGRGLGVLDLARAVRGCGDGVVRCDGALAAHVVEAMEGVLRSAETGQRVELTTRPERPTAVW